MSSHHLNDRRSVLKLLAAAPLFAFLASKGLAGTVSGTIRRTSSSLSYASLGLRPLINARGTYTYLSGSLELPGARKALQDASFQFVNMWELQHAAGKWLAELSGAESGMVTSGAAGAIAAATAGCIAGTNQDYIWQLPDTTGLKHEVVMLGGRNAFDSAIRLAGGKLMIAPTLNELPAAITPETVMVYTAWRDSERISAALQITRAAGVPLFVDASSAIPPFENFTRFAKLGVDFYTFSGGKGLGGPQCSGLLIGRKDLIDAAMANSCPWEGSVCRAMKVGKEEVMGILAAVDYWSRADLGKLNTEWQRRVQRIAKLVETVPGVTTSIAIPQGSNSYPTLTINWDEKRFGLTVDQCVQQMRDGEPRIEMLSGTNASLLAPVRKQQTPRPNLLQVVSFTLQPGEDLTVGNRLRQVLEKARKQST